MTAGRVRRATVAARVGAPVRHGETRGGRGVHVLPVAERVHELGRSAKRSDLTPHHGVTAVLVPREVGRHEPAGARGQDLEREHGRGHREPAHDHRVRGVQVRVAELPFLAAQVQRADDRLRQVFGLQVFHDARLHVRQHSAGAVRRTTTRKQQSPIKPAASGWMFNTIETCSGIDAIIIAATCRLSLQPRHSTRRKNRNRVNGPVGAKERRVGSK